MIVELEIPATDTFEVAHNPTVRTSNGKNVFVIGDSFFIKFDSAEELAHALIALPTEDGPSEDTALD